jgi:hypothetical protein
MCLEFAVVIPHIDCGAFNCAITSASQKLLLHHASQLMYHAMMHAVSLIVGLDNTSPHQAALQVPYAVQNPHNQIEFLKEHLQHQASSCYSHAAPLAQGVVLELRDLSFHGECGSAIVKEVIFKLWLELVTCQRVLLGKMWITWQSEICDAFFWAYFCASKSSWFLASRNHLPLLLQHL